MAKKTDSSTVPRPFRLPNRFHLEVNCIPSALNTSTATGVASQLANVAADSERSGFDGVTIEQMRDNPLYQRGDKIDKIGLAQRRVADAARVVSEPKRAKLIRSLNEHASKIQKPLKS